MLIGIDIGGTFTDFVLFRTETGEIQTWKQLSTPTSPERAVLDGLADLEIIEAASIVHGSTVATNAVLERNGAKTALITTRGFKDLLTIGRQNREDLYDFFSDRPSPLVPRNLCFEISERIDHSGAVLEPLRSAEIEELINTLTEAEVESVAVSCLFSFLNRKHETELAEHLRAAGFPASVSHEIIPEFREFERTSTTVVNAFVAPIMEGYLDRLHMENKLDGLRIMQSNGGCLSVRNARQLPVNSILSGPSAGVIGAQFVAQQAGYERIITLDMGGTSTDVCLIDGKIPYSSETSVAGYPIRIPVIDIHSIGSGGGSIAYRDAGGALRVGPQSAGASPGPVCYDLGGLKPTVTDANLVSGRLPPDSFLAGELRLNHDAAFDALDLLAEELGLEPNLESTPAHTAALGVIQIVNAHMARALRAISVDRGFDPREFTLVSFGGAGGLHASELAREVGVKRVLIPMHASTLSALGMLTAKVMRNYVLTVMIHEDLNYLKLSQRFEPLREQAIGDLKSEGFEAKDLDFEQSLDIRYIGQSYELQIPLREDFIDAFHQRHFELYAHADHNAEIEIVNLRLQVAGSTRIPQLLKSEPIAANTSVQPMGEQRCLIFNSTRNEYQWIDTPLYAGEDLAFGQRIEGPAIIVKSDTTIYLHPGDQASVDTYQNVMITLSDNENVTKTQ